MAKRFPDALRTGTVRGPDRGRSASAAHCPTQGTGESSGIAVPSRLLRTGPLPRRPAATARQRGESGFGHAGGTVRGPEIRTSGDKPNSYYACPRSVLWENFVGNFVGNFVENPTFLCRGVRQSFRQRPDYALLGQAPARCASDNPRECMQPSAAVPVSVPPGASLRESLNRENANLELDLSKISLVIQGFQRSSASNRPALLSLR